MSVVLFQKAVQFCVGNDILCESVDEARDIAYKSKEGRTVCTVSACVFLAYTLLPESN